MGKYHRARRADPVVRERLNQRSLQRYRDMTDVERAEYNRRITERKRNNATNLTTKYKMTLSDYNKMLDAQGGGCAICGQKPSEARRLSVDHDHACCPSEKTCGACVRGLLCVTCNVWLGFYENKKWTAKADKYLDSFVPLAFPKIPA
ncbi:endonuclease VII domain-containing protein [Rothia koreensis]|uniref:endonuclease VII domain-containing protein n=1 Tax=Rothia koreensis TaxID=592378 RepID=UPI003FCE3DC8